MPPQAVLQLVEPSGSTTARTPLPWTSTRWATGVVEQLVASSARTSEEPSIFMP